MKISELFQRIIFYLRKNLNQFDKTYKFKVRAYRTIIDKIKQKYNPNDTVTYSSLIKEIPMSEKMLIHFAEIFAIPTKDIRTGKNEKGTVKSIDKPSDKSRIIQELTDVSGIGKGRAEELYSAGVRKISDLKRHEFFSTLPIESKTFINYPPLRQIPHDFIKELQIFFEENILYDLIQKSNNRTTETKTKKLYTHAIVGSFRRKAKFSRDIDLMVVSDTPIISMIYEKINKTKGIDFKVYANGPDKVAGILIIDCKKTNIDCDTIKKNKVMVKMDIFQCNKKEYPFMLLYSTGSKNFNLTMRAHAKRLGMLLNQRGLFKDGKLISGNVKTEQEIFHLLDMEYVSPEMRS